MESVDGAMEKALSGGQSDLDSNLGSATSVTGSFGQCPLFSKGVCQGVVSPSSQGYSYYKWLLQMAMQRTLSNACMRDYSFDR